MRTFVSTAIMQLLSAGKRSLREETHARDPCLQARDGSLAIRVGLVDGLVYRLNAQANTLVVPERQLDRRFQNAVGIDGLDCLRHRTLQKSNTTTHWTSMQPNKGQTKWIQAIQLSEERRPDPPR